MPVIEFEAKGLEELRKRMNQAPEQLRIALNDGLREIGHTIVPSKGTGPLADETPVKTGKLRRSTFFRIEGGIYDQALSVMQPAKTADGEFYGHFVRGGTRPHIIRARYAKALHFFMGDTEVFAKEVHHPGTQPNPYHLRVLAELMPAINDIIGRMAERVARFISTGK
jgi:hypothetical protein